MDSEEISKLYRVWNSLMKMIQDRDYNVPDELIARSQFNFKQILQENPKRSALNTEISRNNDPNSKIFIHFDDSPTVSVPIISSLAQKMNAEHVQSTLITRTVFCPITLPTEAVAKRLCIQQNKARKIAGDCETCWCVQKVTPRESWIERICR